MVARKTLEDWLNSYLEVEKVADYLPNGLQIEGKDKISKIVTAVSINLEVVEAAVVATEENILPMRRRRRYYFINKSVWRKNSKE